MPRAEPEAAGERAAIILFGAGVRPDGEPTLTLARRIDAANRFGETLPVPPLYLPSGGVGRHSPAEAVVMARRLLHAGVTADRILTDERARDTLDTVFNVRAMLRDLGHRGPVFAATSAYHLPRCIVLLRLAGLAARPVPPPPEPASHLFLRRWRWRLREVPALPWDALLLFGRELIDRWKTKR
ncbi:YdcF family protein [Acetobacteraceae bacterium KSS8]|uniref:YdcF family protein n=1 Tax=Endosaccharibacter trunci TaxID=2812733 RepID=A0ABT1W911_9PROT|nr:YdcF family protein [Acetobacteraceae bacterium KSS8]